MSIRSKLIFSSIVKKPKYFSPLKDSLKIKIVWRGGLHHTQKNWQIIIILYIKIEYCWTKKRYVFILFVNISNRAGGWKKLRTFIFALWNGKIKLYSYFYVDLFLQISLHVCSWECETIDVDKLRGSQTQSRNI